ncbi:LysR family transcriptional regulator [Sinisalibacter aestuarii]|uniref:LysR family transcriptional regulator n=1 Tax=Sinisalibacter aestuarii TaxID=2949426 RepID=A0ABQ5LND2_9RHOB|nr:LysR family transcriptional regulator [Sinisalibacter aestuarii]GKY86490.1 LysR family transcriptional regulator [Sinisalibacter aestuarii]
MDWSRIPSLAALRAFDALARHGGYSAAARELNVTHAAIAQHVRTLETHFGEALAARDGRTIRLTDTGIELAAALADGFAKIEDGVTRILDRNTSRPVVVSLTPTFAETWLMPRMGTFWAAHPEIEVRLVPGIALVDMRRDGIDLAIRFGDGDWPGYEVEPLDLSQFVVVAGRGYTEARDLAALGDLSRHYWFFSGASREQAVWGREIGVDFAQVRSEEMANNSIALSAVRAGLGLSIQSRALVESDLAAGVLYSLFEGDPAGLGYHIVTRPGVLSPGARTFRAWLRTLARIQPQV